MSKHNREVLCFVIIDHDRKLFNVIESVNNNGWWEERMNDVRKQNRDVRGYSSVNRPDIARKDYERQFGYTYTMDSVLIPYM